MIPLVVEEIRRLSQEEGLNDSEIAEKLGIARATVNRCRKANNIPTANLENRKDKCFTCDHCRQPTAVARKERKGKYCHACKQKFISAGIWRGKK